MPREKASEEEIAKWDRWFGVEFNNRAWNLTEKPTLTEAEREEMLHCAHAARLHWGRIGTELHVARAEMLLGQAHSIVGDGEKALLSANKSFAYVTSHQSENWELALAHAVLAHAYFAAGKPTEHAKHYLEAERFGEAISNSPEKAIFLKTLARVPVPRPD